MEGIVISLIQTFGNYQNDLSKLLLQQRELFKLSSSPVIVYKIKDKADQPSSDSFYGEVLDKRYDNGIELIMFWQVPSLIQELNLMGLDVPEQITMFVDSEWMLSRLGRTFKIGDLIQPSFQRNQLYVVQNAFPNWQNIKFYKTTQWQLICQKYQLSGYRLPDYLLWDECTSYFPFSEHWMTEFIQDRKAYREQRSSRIYGNLDYFWQKGDFYEQYEVGMFNGVDNYLNFGDNYNYGANGWAFEMCIKPDLAGSGFISGTDNVPLFNKGQDLKAEVGSDGSIDVYFYGQHFTAPVGTVVTDVWNVLLFNFDRTNSTFKIYKNGLSVTSGALTPFNFTNASDFLIGADFDLSGKYTGWMSNIRIFSTALTDTQALLNEYTNLITRNFWSM